MTSFSRSTIIDRLSARWRSLSDDEYVEHTRRSLAAWDRWGRLIFILYLLVALALLGLTIALVVVLSRFGPMMPGGAPAIAFGLVMGLMWGMSVGCYVAWILIAAWLYFHNFRGDRLLVTHHDALRRRGAATEASAS
jgi:hypothetical protein